MSESVVAILGGSGLGQALASEQGQTHDLDTPFGKPSAPIVESQWEGRRVLILQRHGEGHTRNPSAVPYRANLFALKALGATHVVASGAVGSLREGLRPGDLVLVDQIIDKTTQRPSTFYEHAAVHVELADPCCPVMRRWLAGAAQGLVDDAGRTVAVHQRGTYVCMEGPAFSTRAESHMHRAWGADLVGMTAMPEARLAREAELAYALVAMPTDYDSWRPHDAESMATPGAAPGATPGPAPGEPQALLQEIIGNLQRATAANLALIRRALLSADMLDQQPSPAHQALSLGIWSDKAKIDPAEVQRLAPLWGRYFEG
ncbi:MAG: MTAP family purine nucleoside phosphorylase [Planctomycetota bacterium]